METLSSTIKRRRLELGLSQTQIEQKTRGAISNSHLSRIEAGQARPHPDKLRALAKALRLRYFDLLRVAGYVRDEDIPDSVTVYAVDRALPEDARTLLDCYTLLPDQLKAFFLDTGRRLSEIFSTEPRMAHLVSEEGQQRPHSQPDEEKPPSE